MPPAELRKAQTLNDIWQNVMAQPLRMGDLEFFVETDQARNPNETVRGSIRSILEFPDARRILLYGHHGCGKSTELEKLAQELADQFFVVTIDIYKETNPFALTAADVVMVIVKTVLEAARDVELNVAAANPALQAVRSYFSEIILKTENLKESDLLVEAGVKAQTPSILAVLGGLFAKLSSQIKYSTGHTETAVTHVRSRPGDLVARANTILGIVEDAVRAQKNGRKLVIIVENLEKIGMSVGHEVFVNNPQILAGLNTRIIYTFPISLFCSPHAVLVRSAFGNYVSMPMIKINEENGRPFQQGRALVREIVFKRIDDALITPGALNLLIAQTGGVLRHVFEVLRTAANHNALKNANQDRGPIDEIHIDYALGRLQTELVRMIAVPLPVPLGLEGTQGIAMLYNRLVEIALSQDNGSPAQPSGDVIDMVLLQAALLIEYNGRGWLGVHPLIRQHLEQSGRIKTPVAKGRKAKGRKAKERKAKK